MVKYGPPFPAQIDGFVIPVHQNEPPGTLLRILRILRIRRIRRIRRIIWKWGGELQLPTTLHTRARITYDGSRRN